MPAKCKRQAETPQTKPPFSIIKAPATRSVWTPNGLFYFVCNQLSDSANSGVIAQQLLIDNCEWQVKMHEQYLLLEFVKTLDGNEVLQDINFLSIFPNYKNYECIDQHLRIDRLFRNSVNELSACHYTMRCINSALFKEIVVHLYFGITVDGSIKVLSCILKENNQYLCDADQLLLNKILENIQHYVSLISVLFKQKNLEYNSALHNASELEEKIAQYAIQIIKTCPQTSPAVYNYFEQQYNSLVGQFKEQISLINQYSPTPKDRDVRDKTIFSLEQLNDIKNSHQQERKFQVQPIRNQEKHDFNDQSSLLQDSSNIDAQTKAEINKFLQLEKLKITRTKFDKIVDQLEQLLCTIDIKDVNKIDQIIKKIQLQPQISQLFLQLDGIKKLPMEPNLTNHTKIQALEARVISFFKDIDTDDPVILDLFTEMALKGDLENVSKLYPYVQHQSLQALSDDLFKALIYKNYSPESNKIILICDFLESQKNPDYIKRLNIWSSVNSTEEIFDGILPIFGLLIYYQKIDVLKMFLRHGIRLDTTNYSFNVGAIIEDKIAIPITLFTYLCFSAKRIDMNSMLEVLILLIESGAGVERLNLEQMQLLGTRQFINLPSMLSSIEFWGKQMPKSLAPVAKTQLKLYSKRLREYSGILSEPEPDKISKKNVIVSVNYKQKLINFHNQKNSLLELLLHNFQIESQEKQKFNELYHKCFSLVVKNSSLPSLVQAFAIILFCRPDISYCLSTNVESFFKFELETSIIPNETLVFYLLENFPFKQNPQEESVFSDKKSIFLACDALKSGIFNLIDKMTYQEFNAVINNFASQLKVLEMENTKNPEHNENYFLQKSVLSYCIIITMLIHKEQNLENITMHIENKVNLMNAILYITSNILNTVENFLTKHPEKANFYLQKAVAWSNIIQSFAVDELLLRKAAMEVEGELVVRKIIYRDIPDLIKSVEEIQEISSRQLENLRYSSQGTRPKPII